MDGRKGLPITSFIDPEPEGGLEREPSQTELMAYATELLMATIHEAADKIAAAILTAKLFEVSPDLTPVNREQAMLRERLFQGYNSTLESFRAVSARAETEDGGTNDG